MRWRMIGLAVGLLLMAIFDLEATAELWGGK